MTRSETAIGVCVVQHAVSLSYQVIVKFMIVGS